MKKVLFIVSLIITNIIITLCIINLNNKSIISQRGKIAMGSNIAVMIYDESVDEYVKNDTIPIGNFEMNMSKTRCISGGTLSNYDSVNGTISYILDNSDECYIYFDKNICNKNSNLVDCIKSLHTYDGANDLYLHDGAGTHANATLEAGDNSLRYSGANPNNYVCFKKENCTEDDLFRIIGVFNNYIKLVKYTSAAEIAWNSSGNNTWNGSTIEQYLKNVWLPSFEFSDYLIYINWNVDGLDNATIHSPNTVKTAYIYESQNVSNYYGKAALMTASEFGYTSSPELWHYALFNDDNISIRFNGIWATNHSWGYRNKSYTSLAMLHGSNGHTYPQVPIINEKNVTPAVCVDSNIKYFSGFGTKNNPMIIGK